MEPWDQRSLLCTEKSHQENRTSARTLLTQEKWTLRTLLSHNLIDFTFFFLPGISGSSVSWRFLFVLFYFIKMV